MFDVIENNNEFLIISKHPDVSVNKCKGPKSLIQLVREKLKVKSLISVHRLDKVTSGLLIYAKTEEVARELNSLFKDKRVEKYYLAISNKKPTKKQGAIIGDIKPARKGAFVLTRTKVKPAKTQFFCSSMGSMLRLFILKPLTGKTHQLRVSMRAIGSPILGDHLYSSKTSAKSADRTYLHAYSLGFELSGKSYRFIDIPKHGELFNSEEFKKILVKFSKPWDLKWPKRK